MSTADAELATLRDFPHREEVPISYFVDRSHWPNVKKLLKNPSHFCCGREGRPIYAVLRTLSILAALAALAIALVKDFMDEDDSLPLSAVELACALVAVSSSVVKHGIEWRHIRKDLRSFERLQESKSVKCSKRCPGYFIGTLIAIWLFCTSFLLIGLAVFHSLDSEKHSFLEYTKFSTAFIVFISWVLDALVTEGLSEMTLNWTVDRYALLIHMFKEELYHELKFSGKEDRIDQIEKFLIADEIFDVDRNRRILAKGREHQGTKEYLI